MTELVSKVTTSGRFEILGQVGKVPCKIEVSVEINSPVDALNYCLSEVQDFVSGQFPPATFSHERGLLDFEDLNLNDLLVEILESTDVTACQLILNGVQCIAAQKFRPFN